MTSALTESRHELLIDALAMSGARADEGRIEEGYTFTVLSEGIALGSSDPVLAVVRSLWGDGSSARIEGHDNATTEFYVRVKGVNHQAVAQGLADLRNALPDGRDEQATADLIWRPADGHSPASVRTILVGVTEHGPFVDDEHMNMTCRVRIKLTCAPHVRSEKLVTVEALPVGEGATVVIDTCDSAAGWTVHNEAGSGPASDGGGAVIGTTVVPDKSYVQVALERDGVVPFASAGTPYLIVEAKVEKYGVSTWGPAPEVSVYLAYDGAMRARVASAEMTDGYRRLVYHVPEASLPVLWFSTSVLGGVTDAMRLVIRHVERAATPTMATPRQGSHTFDILGTERTPGSITVASRDGVTGLGTVMVQLGPGSTTHTPALRPHRTAGGTVSTDASCLSGSREPINADRFYAQPPMSAVPEGPYNIIARMRCATTSQVNVDWRIATRALMDSGEAEQTGTTGWPFTAGVWTLVPLAVEVLPTVRADWGAIEIEIQRAAGFAATLELDDAWLARVGDDCALIVVETSRPQLRIDTADVLGRAPRIWVGDGASWRHPGGRLLAMGNPVLNPRTGALVNHATTGVDNPKVTAEYYPRWDQQAAL